MSIKLENWYDEVVKKLLSLEYLIQFINTIHNDSAEYFTKVVQPSNFFYTAHRLAVKVIIIDFITLTNHRENYNLSTLLNSLIKFHNEIQWKNKLYMQAMKGLRKDFKKVITSDVYIKLKNTRDKYYVILPICWTKRFEC